MSGIPVLGIDIDGCVDDHGVPHVDSYSGLAACVVSYAAIAKRRSRTWRDTALSYDQLFLVKSLDGKAELIVREGIFGLFR
jgi:hypothetical protein